MGHVALPILQQLVENEMVAGIRLKGEPDEVLGCPTCMQAKFTRFPFSSSEATAKARLDEVVMDVVGPLTRGDAGAKYFLTIVDVYTRMTWVYVLSKKSDVAETKNGIRHSLTMPYSHAMNGIAERANRTITEMARGLLIEAGLPYYFWPDAVRSVCVAKNRALTHVGADKSVPYVEWIGRKPKVDMLRVFGCMCMVLVPKHLRHNKLGAKVIWAVHLGMAQNSKGWLLWDPFTKKFLVSRDCKFMENLVCKDWKEENGAKMGVRFGEVKSSGLEHVELPLKLSSGRTTTRQSSLMNGGEEAKDAEEEEEEVQHVSEPKSALAGAAMMVGDDEESEYEEFAFAFFSPVEMPGEPATLKEALESRDAEEWNKAMESELKSIEENGTWELVELLEGRKAIMSNWLFKIKSYADGEIERYKSRLVAKGYQQKENVEYKELFAPVVKPTTLRTLLAGATIEGWVVKQMDVTTAFLNGILKEYIFLAQPEGPAAPRAALCSPLAAPAAPPAAPSPLDGPCCPLAACLWPARRPLAALVPASRPAFHPCCSTGRAPPSLPAMTSLCRGGWSGDGSGGSSGSGGGDTSNRCEAVRWGVSGGGQMLLQEHQRESLQPQQLREWYASRSGGGGSRGSRWAAALGASESALPGTTPAEALHTFTLDSHASRCFFRDRTTLTPLSAPVPVRLANSSGGPVLARSSTGLPCPAVLSGSLSGLHLPSFSTNLVSTAALQDAMVTTTTSRGQRVSICTCTWTGRHLATFTYRRGSSLSTLDTEPPQVAASTQVSLSGPVAPPCSCRTRLSCGTTALVTPPCHAFVACTPASLSLVFPCLCLPSRPHLPRPAFLASRGASALLLTLPRFPRRLLPCRLSTWTCGAQPASVDRAARYFLLVVDDYTRYTTVFPLRSKGEVPDVLIPWIRKVRLQLCEQFRQVLPVLRLHSDIGETSPTLHWTGKVGNASVFRVWGSRAIVCDTSAEKLSSRAILCIFLGFPPDASGWQFYHPTSCRVFPSLDVTCDESVPFYRLFPYRSAPPPPPPLFLAPGPPPVDPLPPHGLATSGAARGAASGGAEPGGAESEGARSGGAEPAGVEPGGAEPEGVEPGGAESEGAESEGAEPRGTASSGGPAGASPRLSPRLEPLSPQQLCKWFAQRTRLQSGAAGAGDSAAGDSGAGGAGVIAGARGTRGAAVAGPRGARTKGTGAAGTAGGAGAVDSGAGGAGAGGDVSGGTGAGGTVRP
ncbi:unnamed protein product [Closterium sp. NIES-54]